MQPPLTQGDLVQLLAIEPRWFPNRDYGLSPDLVALAEKLVAEEPLLDGTRAALNSLRTRLTDLKPASAARRLRSRLDVLLGPPEVAFDQRDEWAKAIMDDLCTMPTDRRATWLGWFSGKKTAKAVGSSISALGEGEVRNQLVSWISGVRAPLPRDEEQFGIQDAFYRMKDDNSRLLGGLVAGAALIADPLVARALGDLAAVCFTKTPDVGAYSHRVGNECVRALGLMECAEAVPELSRLASRVKYVVAKRLVERALKTCAERRGTTVESLQEDSVPDYGLAPEGRRCQSLAAGAVELSIADARAQVRWIDENGRARSSVPASVRRLYVADLTQVRKVAKDLDRQLTTQCARLERVMATDRTTPIADWRRRYIDHPVLAALGGHLVWEHGDTTFRIRSRDLVDVAGRTLSPDAKARIRLWHPLRSPPDEVVAWRRVIEEERITQPFAQAHRETYSARPDAVKDTQCAMFAGHYLREWVLASLFRERGWRYALQVGDPGGFPTLAIPGHGLNARFRLVGTNEWTDQYESMLSADVDFVRDDGVVVPLCEVPRVVFSEVLRDVDLFVSRASVRGVRDPGSLVRPSREYWQKWSHGGLLGETDRQRALTLQRMLPTLDFGRRCDVSDAFLRVNASVRQYRIHVGTGDVIVDDQLLYLDKATLRKSASVVWLPFRGDAVLADILTKARYLSSL